MQSKRGSLIEAAANTVIGYLVAVAANVAVLPMFGLRPSVSQSFGIGLVFTLGLGKRIARENTITDVLTTTNSKGDIVKIEYVITHKFMGQDISEVVVDATIARNLKPSVLAHYC